MKKSLLPLAATALIALASSARAELVFDFEEGAFGTKWFDLTQPGDGPNLNLNISSDTNVRFSGSYSLGPGNNADRDANHAGPLHVRSIPFTLNGSGDMTWLHRAGHSSAMAPDLGTGPISINVQGIALTRVSDGERVLSAKIANQNANISTGTFTAAQLAPFVAEVGETWVIDVFDTRTEAMGTTSGWESLHLDDITIPGEIAISGPEIVVEQPESSGISNGGSRDFGTVISGLTADLTFTIRNIGTDALELTGTPLVDITGTHASDFTVTEDPTTPVAADGGTTTFTVRFAPAAAGPRSATLLIANNDADESPFTINLSGTGQEPGPKMAVEQSVATAIPNGGSRDFGTVAAGSDTELTFTIRNTGNVDLDLSGTPMVDITGTHAGDFAVTLDPTTPVAANGGTTTFTVRFAPLATGPRGATLSIANNDADQNPFTINLSGKATTFDFEEGAFGTKWFDLTQPGDGPNLNLNISSDATVRISGSWSLGPGRYAERDADHAGPLHVRSVPFTLDDSGDLTWKEKYGHSTALAPALGTGPISQNVQGIALTRLSNGERVLSARIANQNNSVHERSFTAEQLAPFVAETGELWVLDVFDSRSVGGWESIALDDITVPGATVPGVITSFQGAGATGVINYGAGTISLKVPFDTDLATLAPTFTLSSGICDQPSGAPPSPTFAAQNPVTYTVTDDSTDPDTVNAYTVTVTVASPPPPAATLVIDLGASPAGTRIAGGTFIGIGPTNLPIPALPPGSILRSIEVDTVLEASDVDAGGNYASDLTVLFDPTPGDPGNDFSLGIKGAGAPTNFGAANLLSWPESADTVAVSPLIDTKTDADWAAAVGDIDLATTGLFLGNAFGDAPKGGTWSGTITLTYDLVGTGSGYDNWAGGEPFDGDKNGDGVSNGLAFLLGAANPEENALGRLPTATETAGGLVLSFSCLPSGDRGTAELRIEYSSDLRSWTATTNQVPDADGTDAGGMVSFVVTGPSGTSSVNSVTATINASAAAGGKLFGRLKAEKP